MNAGKLGLLSVGLTLSLAACGILGGNGPAITSFSANPPTIMAGGSSTLTWQVDSSATSISISGVGNVTNQTSATVEPTVTTDYTLTATSAEGGTSTRTTRVTVSGDDTGSGNGPGVPSDPTSLPEGDFGVSASATGTFENDTGPDGLINSDSDPRIIDVSAPGTFYAQVDYTDPDGIQGIDIILQNGSPTDLRGPLSSTPRGGFTLGEPTGCDLSTNPTQVTCVYPITVAAGTVDISELDGAGSEFAYVFRATVTDSQGNSVFGTERGYVNIQ